MIVIWCAISELLFTIEFSKTKFTMFMLQGNIQIAVAAIFERYMVKVF